MNDQIDPTDRSKAIRTVCERVRNGMMTFDEGVDYFIEHDKTSHNRGRIEYTDFLWSLLGRPTDEQLLEWERLGGRKT